MHVLDEGDGPAVVLLHAYPCDNSMWDDQAEALVSAGLRVIRPDLPGFGASPVLAAEPSLEEVARVVLDSVDATSFALAGLSMGGYVAMQMLRLQPERVAALALVDTKATADTEEARATRLATAAKAEQAGSLTAMTEGMLSGLLGTTTLARRPEIVARTAAFIGRASGDGAAWAMRAMAARPDSLAVLSAFDRPSVVVMGEEDALSPLAEHEAMVAALANGRLVTIPECGHLSALEQPAAVSDALMDLLEVR